MRSVIDIFAEQDSVRNRMLNSVLSSPMANVGEALRALTSRTSDMRSVMDQWRTPVIDTLRISRMSETARIALDMSDMFRGVIGQISNRETVLDASFKVGEATRFGRQFLDTISAEPAEGEGPIEIDWKILDQRLTQLNEIIAQAPSKGDAGRLIDAKSFTRYEWVTIYMMLFGFLLGIAQVLLQYQANASDERGEVEQRQFRERVMSALNELEMHVPEESLPYAVAARITYVKSKIAGGLHVGTVYPNQLVVITAKQGRWVKVKFRDHIEGRDVEGWLLKHYLVRVDAQFKSKASTKERKAVK